MINNINYEQQSVLKIQQHLTIWQCRSLPNLVGQRGVIALKDIPKDTVVGQYHGTMSFQYQNMSLKSDHNFVYSIPIESSESNSFKTVVIDPLALGIDVTQFPIFMLNDPRQNLKRSTLTLIEANRQNCKFSNFVYKGIPIALVHTVKKISSGKQLFIDYGPRFQ